MGIGNLAAPADGGCRVPLIVPRDLESIYRDRMLDPLAVLPWLAGVTRRISLGTRVVILPYRSPIPVAKLLASGGGSEGAFRRVARYGDGWHATATNHDAFRQGQQAIERYLRESGREGTPMWTLRLPRWPSREFVEKMG